MIIHLNLSSHLDKSIKYCEYIAESINSVDYSEYLSNRSISYVEYLAEHLGVNKDITLVGKIKKIKDRRSMKISYSEYLRQNLDRNISYEHYLD